jgi:hypothetical protein
LEFPTLTAIHFDELGLNDFEYISATIGSLPAIEFLLISKKKFLW